MATIELISTPTPAPDVPGIIFVHGLSGDPRETWTVPGPGWDGECFWPRWLARERADLAIWTVGYAAPKARWPRQSVTALPLYDRARELLDQLTITVGDRPLLFIAHSLGGLVVKELLRTARDEPAHYGWLLRATYGVIFLGTPHRGAWSASALNHFAPLLVSAAIRDLEAHGAHLRQLNRWYSVHAPQLGILTASYYETRPLRGILVVDEDSADPGIANAPLIAIDSDHHNICKPMNPETHVYSSVRQFVTNWLASPVSNKPERAVSPAMRAGRVERGLRAPAATHTLRSLIAHLTVALPPQLDAAIGSDAPEHLCIFVSSAMAGGKLRRERDIAIAAIDGVGFARAWAWERESSGGPSVRAECIARASRSDALVLILEGELTPIARQEYRAARDSGRACYILVKDGTLFSPAMEEFIERESSVVPVARFGNNAELETCLVTALYTDIVRAQRASRRDTGAMGPRR